MHYYICNRIVKLNLLICTNCLKNVLSQYNADIVLFIEVIPLVCLHTYYDDCCRIVDSINCRNNCDVMCNI